MEGLQEVKVDQVLKDQNPTSMQELLSNFHGADLAALMRRYVMGFTPIILSSMATDTDGRLSKLRKTKGLSDGMYGTVKIDRHRVKAFPACVASHLLPSMKDDDLLYAGELIGEAMEFPQREIQEIVPQNLISVLTRDQYSWNNMWVTDRVLESMLSYLSRRTTNPLLCTGSNLTIQFLLYYRLSLASRQLGPTLAEARKRQDAMIEKAIAEIASATDTYSWFVKQWLKVVEDCCKYVMRTSPTKLYKALPPQSSELVLGWKNCYTDRLWFPVLASAILNNALLVHLNREIVADRGKPSWLQREYGKEEAAVALGKGEQWFRNLAFHDTIFEEALKRTEEPLKATLKGLAENTAHRSTPSEEWHPDWSLVPFRDSTNPLEPYLKKFGENPQRYLTDLFGEDLLLIAYRGLVKLTMDYWTPIAKHTPAEVEEAARPDSETLEAELSAKEVLKVLLAHQDLVEGNASAYDDLAEGGVESAVRTNEEEKRMKLTILEAEDPVLVAIKKAIEAAKKCQGENDKIHPKVGAVIMKDKKIVTVAHRGEMAPGNHAEYTALVKKCGDMDLTGATLITTLEPCTMRTHDKKPCAQHIVERHITKVVIGMLDPNPAIRGKGILFLQRRDIEVEFFPSAYQKQVIELNKDFWDDQWKNYRTDLMRELAPEAEAFAKRIEADMSRPTIQDSAIALRERIFNVLKDSLSMEEVKTLCFVANVDYDELEGQTKSGKIRELVMDCYRGGRLSDLLEAIRRFSRELYEKIMNPSLSSS